MKYIQTIFENENVRDLVVANENIIQSATNHLLEFNIALETLILGNLDSYVVEGDLTATYNNITNHVIHENVKVINMFSSLLQENEAGESDVSELLNIAKNLLWEEFQAKVMATGNTAVFNAASCGILGTDAQKWADDASSQIMSGAATSKEGSQADLTSAISSTKESGNPVKTKTGDSLATNVSTNNKLAANLPDDGGPVPAGSKVTEDLGVAAIKTVKPGSVFSRGKLNKVIDPTASSKVDHLLKSKSSV